MMGIFLAYVGFVFFSVLYVQQGLSSQAKFTEFPRNVTATEGQNVEMSCAFQSGSASVYLEIQWWFLRGPEDLEPAAEVAGAQVELVPDRDPDNDGTKISTVKVQGNDISHKLQISKVRKKDEGLYECRVTDANYGELQEHKAQAYLKVNTNSHARRMQAFEASPMWLQDMKPRKNVSAAAPSSSIHSSANQRTAPTSSSQAVAKIPKQSPQSGVGLNVIGIVNTYYGYHRFPTKRRVICRKQTERKRLQNIKYHQTKPRSGGQQQNYQHYEATRRTLF